MSRSPRLAFLGVGWIGRHRMEKLIAGGAEAIGIADPSADNLGDALRLAPGAVACKGIDDLLEGRPDGLVIATPSALHAQQAIIALERGVAVFCQKPLGRDADEVEAVLAAARRADRRIGVDLSYRFTAGIRAIKALLDRGELGRVYAVDLVFHNAYGPDKPWFYDPAQSGGGCLMDLGVHLIDLALWAMDFPPVVSVSGHAIAKGKRFVDRGREVEDYAVAELVLDGGVIIRLACSWRLPAGQDAVIAAEFYGTQGGAALQNVGGSFYDFTASHFRGTTAAPLATGPDDWGGRAAMAWMNGLSRPGYDREANHHAEVARTIDRIYEAAMAPPVL